MPDHREDPIVTTDHDKDLSVLIERKYLLEWRLHRQREIDAAIAIIRPEPGQGDACREDVEKVGMRNAVAIGWLIAKDKSRTKEGKAAAGRLAKVLRRLLAALREEDLDHSIAAAAVTRHISLEQILDAAEYCEEVKSATTGKLIRKDAEAKRRAVKLAHELLVKYAKDRAGDATRGSSYCRLAALLYGEPDDDLHHQCLQYLRLARASREKWGSK